ncbi:MAG: hypothetical protein CMK00_03540 [Planctomycetes bacterium]|jgi:hypothetical protein|nr:hypothetical protein [Planctomycetota bacterium]
MIRKHEPLLCVLFSTLAACAPPADGGGPPTAAASSTKAPPTNRVDIPATVRRNLGITFAAVEVRNVAQTLRVPGAFELQPLARQEYRMALPGRVQLLVDQFDRVEAGTPLYRYQSLAWAELVQGIVLGEQAMAIARSEIKVCRAKLGEARRKLEMTRERIAVLARADFKKADLEAQAGELAASLPRLTAEAELAETRLANGTRTWQQALLRAAAATGISEAELKAEVPAKDGAGESVPGYLMVDWIEVRASEFGVVELLAVANGAFVEPPATVVSTVDPQLLRFRAQALQDDLPKVANAGEARIVPPSSPGTAGDAGVGATMRVGLEAHPEERTVTLIATPEAGAGWIRSGFSAFLEVVVSGTGEPALAVPRSAVVQDGLTHVFFRRDPANPNQAIRVEADMGVSDGQWVVLNSGVMRGDEVVLAGAYELKLATQQSGAAQKGGHFHADGSHHEDH